MSGNATELGHLLQLEEAWIGTRLTTPQLKVLFVIVAHDGISGPNLQRRLNLLPSTLTRIADKLVSAELIERNETTGDRRIVTYLPTEAGRKTVLTLMPPP